MSHRLALFDCDGTLVDSQHMICLAMADAFAAHGLPAPSRKAILRVVGLNLIEAMRIMRPKGRDDDHVRLAEDYKTAFQRLRGNGLVDEPLYAGIAEVIDTLATAGWRLGIATGKSDRGLALCLAQHGLTARFATLQTADRHPSKPHPSMVDAAMAAVGASPETTVVIGDTSFDVAMARSAGARAIGVSWGYHEVADLRAAGAHAVARHPRDIPALMEAL